jgi:hypothetical protein
MSQRLFPSQQNSSATSRFLNINSLPFNRAWALDSTWIFETEMAPKKFDAGTRKVYDDGHDMPVVNPWKVIRGNMRVHFAGSTKVRDSWMIPCRGGVG